MASTVDRMAMGLSGLCLVHCLATAILLGLLASAGGILGSPIIHEYYSGGKLGTLGDLLKNATAKKKDR